MANVSLGALRELGQFRAAACFRRRHFLSPLARPPERRRRFDYLRSYHEKVSVVVVSLDVVVTARLFRPGRRRGFLSLFNGKI